MFMISYDQLWHISDFCINGINQPAIFSFNKQFIFNLTKINKNAILMQYVAQYIT